MGRELKTFKEVIKRPMVIVWAIVFPSLITVLIIAHILRFKQIEEFLTLVLISLFSFLIIWVVVSVINITSLIREKRDSLKEMVTNDFNKEYNTTLDSLTNFESKKLIFSLLASTTFLGLLIIYYFTIHIHTIFIEIWPPTWQPPTPPTHYEKENKETRKVIYHETKQKDGIIVTDVYEPKQIWKDFSKIKEAKRNSDSVYKKIKVNFYTTKTIFYKDSEGHRNVSTEILSQAQKNRLALIVKKYFYKTVKNSQNMKTEPQTWSTILVKFNDNGYLEKVERQNNGVTTFLDKKLIKEIKKFKIKTTIDSDKFHEIHLTFAPEYN